MVLLERAKKNALVSVWPIVARQLLLSLRWLDRVSYVVWNDRCDWLRGQGDPKTYMSSRLQTAWTFSRVFLHNGACPAAVHIIACDYLHLMTHTTWELRLTGSLKCSRGNTVKCCSSFRHWQFPPCDYTCGDSRHTRRLHCKADRVTHFIVSRLCLGSMSLHYIPLR